MNKRTFIAVKISPNNNLKNIYQNIKSKFASDKIKWVNTDNFHITLKFFGETRTNDIEKIKSVLGEISDQFCAFDLVIQNFGVFPNQKSPKVFWFGLKNTKQLVEIQHKLETNLILNGFAQEKRDFNPHLTIARPKFIKQTNEILEISKDLKDKVMQKTVIDKIILYESILNKHGANYIPLKINNLTK